MRRFVAYGFLLTILQLLIACGPAAPDAATADSGEATAPAATASPSEPAAAQDQDATQADAKYFVLAFGDSLYAGYGLDQKEGFVPVLQASLKAAGKDVQVHNAGVSGDTAAAGLRRLQFVLDSLKRKPDLVLLGLGGNDLLRGLQPAETRANLEAMLKLLKAQDIPVMLTGLPAPPNLGQQFGDEFNKIYPELAKKYDAKLYPFFLDGLVGKPELFQADSIHPNAQGVVLIVEKITPQVASALPE